MLTTSNAAKNSKTCFFYVQNTACLRFFGLKFPLSLKVYYKIDSFIVYIRPVVDADHKHIVSNQCKGK